MPNFRKPKRRAILKSLGQNFLVDEKVITKIITAASLQPQDTVLEVGPGQGALTIRLAQKAQRVIAVELDRGLAEDLRSKVPANVEIISADVRKLDLRKLNLRDQKFIVVANLPFNVGAAIVRWLLEGEIRPSRLVIILQREVADRILCRDGKESILSLAVKFYGNAQEISSVPRQAYQPVPRVDTTLLQILITKQKRDSAQEKPFFGLIKAGFSAKRKYLANNLAKKLNIPLNKVKDIFKKEGLSFRARAEELSFEDWLRLSNSIKTGE